MVQGVTTPLLVPMREKRRVGPQLLIYRKKRESSSGVSLPKFPSARGGGLLRPAFSDGPTNNLEKWGKKFHYYRLGKETPDASKKERKDDKTGNRERGLDVPWHRRGRREPLASSESN